MSLESVLLDKALRGADDMQLTIWGDFAFTDNIHSILQAAQIRCLAVFGTWVQDPQFGSGLVAYFRNVNAYTVTEDEIQAQVDTALSAMVEDWRIAEIKSIRILTRDSDRVSIEIPLVVSSVNAVIPLSIPVS